MSRLKIIFLVFFGIFSNEVSGASVLSDIELLFDFAKNIYHVVEKTKEIYELGDAAKDQLTGVLSPEEIQTQMMKDMTAKIDEMSVKINEMAKDLSNGLQNIETSVNALPDQLSLSQVVHQIMLAFRKVKRELDALNVYKDENYNSTLKYKFADRMLRNSFISHTMMGGIYGLVMPANGIATGEEPLLQLYQNVLKAHDRNTCSLRAFWYPHQFVYEIYRQVIATELFGYTIMVNCVQWRGVRTSQELNSSLSVIISQEIKDYNEKFMNRISNYSLQFENTLKWMPRDFHTCDPSNGHHIDDTTYLTMRGLYTKIVGLEDGIRSLLQSSDCTGSCEYIDTEHRHIGPFCNYDSETNKYWGEHCGLPYTEKESMFPGRPCHGRVYNCTTMHSVDLCILNTDERRYQSFTNTKDHNTYGIAPQSCKGEVKKSSDFERVTPPPSPWALIFHPPGGRPRLEKSCPTCVCTCEDNGDTSNTVHSIGIDWQESNAYENKVIVGVRFRIIVGALHIQIKEREILSEYGVNTSNADTWSPINSGTMFRIGNLGNAFQLDDLIVPDNEVIIGVKFETVATLDAPAGSQHITLKIATMKYNPKTGKLYGERKEILPSRQKGPVRTLKSDRLPTASSKKNTDISSPGDMMRFTTSNLEQDAGQTTVPFVDAQNVEGLPNFPLVGIGMYHRSSDDSAGFLAIKAFSPNFEKLLQDGRSSDKKP